ncbi:Tyrosinase central domain-containing protein [Mycena sanguinolenta]|uniref:Tyrosinase central domain-containing protein n=1 Tax=Mycena sanguinolenta TaxID=230812 RepID=A0A8H6YNE5_9AGAR|nr:Tyrosinase central domain-containing protein [Mycena sanguinolenta]
MNMEDVSRKTEKQTTLSTETPRPRVPSWLIVLSTIILSALVALHTIIGFGALPGIFPKPRPVGTESRLCARPAIRQEWRTLSNEQKLEYITAVQCLHRLPGISHLQGAKTRFDDFAAVHVVSAGAIHHVGHFLPWHRRFLHVHEIALREECGFEGALPYWDWSLDVASGRSLSESPVFDPVYGFGGNGLDIADYNGSFENHTLMVAAGWVAPGAGGGCVTDGPFAEFMLSVGPGLNITDHCLSRAINDNMQKFLSPARVAELMPLTTFEEFRIEIEGTPVTKTFRVHDGGHIAVGGDMQRFSSPNDPLFYLHHAFLDKIWWDWVGMNFSSRLEDISGPSTVNPPYEDVTLDFELDMMMLAPPVTIREVLETPNQLLCHIYE